MNGRDLENHRRHSLYGALPSGAASLRRRPRLIDHRSNTKVLAQDFCGILIFSIPSSTLYSQSPLPG